MRRYRPFILTGSPAEAPDPLTQVDSLQSLSPLARVANRLSYTLGGPYPHFERSVRKAHCCLLHALSGADGISGLRLKSRTGLPLVTTFSGADAIQLPRRHPHLYAQLFSEGDLFIASAEAIRKELLSLGCPEGRLRVLYPGVDVQEIPFHERAPVEGGPVRVLIAGHLVDRKGLRYGLQAFASASRYLRHVSLTIIGDGPGRREVEAMIREFGLTDVHLLGTQPRAAVLEEMGKAHIFLLPSVKTPDGDVEGIPFALLEAQASGLPVVTTWHSGIPEVVADGRSGYLLSERSAHTMAERLRYLIEHPEVWPSFGRIGRTIIEERFDLRQQLARLEEWYDELLPDDVSGHAEEGAAEE